MVFARIRQFFQGRSNQLFPAVASGPGDTDAGIVQKEDIAFSINHSSAVGAMGEEESSEQSQSSFTLPAFPADAGEQPEYTLPPHETVSTLRKILDTDVFNNAFEKAEELYRDKKWEQVIDQCQCVLELAPNHAPTHKLWGNTLLQLGRRDEARVAYIQALEHDPEFADGHVNLGNLDAQDKRWDEAIAHYQQAIALNPNCAAAYRNLAKVWTRKGSERLATECLFHAIEREPDSLDWHGYFKLGNQLLIQGQPKQAIHCYQYLINIKNELSKSSDDHSFDVPVLHQNLADALAQTEQWQEAVEHYRKAHQHQLPLATLSPPNTFSLNTTAANGLTKVTPLPLFSSALNPETDHAGESALGAVDTLEPINGSGNVNHSNGGMAVTHHHPPPNEVVNELALPDSNPSTLAISPSSILQTAEDLAQQQKWDEVIAVIQQELEYVEPELNQWYELLAKALRIDGNVKGAMGYYQKMIMLYPNQAKPCVNLGSLYAQQEKWPEAKAAYQQAIALDPNCAGAYRNLARVWQSTDDEAAAADCWIKAYELEPDWGTAVEHLELGQTLVKLERVEAAIASFNRAIAKDTTLTQAYFHLADLYHHQGHDELAMLNYGKTLQSDPNQAHPNHCDAIYELGRLLVKHGDGERAIACFQKLVQSEPSSIRGYCSLRDVLVAMNRLDDAILCYQELAELQPESSMAHHELGDRLNQCERWSEAIPTFRRAIELDPNFSWSYNNLGDSLVHLGRWSEARDVLETAIALNSDCFWSHHNLGKVQNELRNWSGAVVALQAAIAIDPDFAWTHYNLGIALAQLNQLEEAIAAYHQAQQIDPSRKDISPKLIKAWQQCISQEPQRMELYQSLAEEWLNDGNIGEAIATYQMLLHIAPNNRTISLAMAQLLEKTDSVRSRSLQERALMPQLPGATPMTAEKLQDKRQVKALLAATSLFDAQYYRAVYDIPHDIDPLEHYLTKGTEQGYNPNPLFDTRYYCQQHSDIEQLGINPLAHYYAFGYVQQCNPHPLFSHERYLAENPDVAAIDLCLLDHYLSIGAKQGRVAFGKETLQNATPKGAPYLNGLSSFSSAETHRDVKTPEANAQIQQTFGIFCNSGGNYFIAEIADHIAASLTQIGHHVLRLSEADILHEQLDHTIIVAPHEFFYIGDQNDWAKKTDWLTQAIMVNVEQPQTTWFSRAFHFLRRSRLILDINVKSAALLHSLNLPVQWLPLGYLENHNAFSRTNALKDSLALRSLTPQIRQTCPALDAPLLERPIDLSFVGVINRRRELFFAQNAYWLSEYRCFWHIPPTGDPLLKGEGQALDTSSMVGLSRRSKILLNLHRDEVPYFEWHRMVFFGLWQNTLVLTEPCHDVPGLVAGEHYIACPLDEMEARVNWLLRTDEGQIEAEKIRTAGYEALRQKILGGEIMQRIVEVIGKMQ